MAFMPVFANNVKQRGYAQKNDDQTFKVKKNLWH